MEINMKANKKSHTPTFALVYDFDRTLSTKEMQEYTYIPGVGKTADEYWAHKDSFAKERKMDGILANMWMMQKLARDAGKPIHREELVASGKDLEFFPGVKGWFKRINKLGSDIGVNIEHYVISSGFIEIIEGSVLWGNFREVYACEFLYDEEGIACWPKNSVNYSTKTQFLFRINKGVLDVSNDYDLNQFMAEEDRPIPFKNMIYIGDGMTDVPSMRLVKQNGGYSIAVYPEGSSKKVVELLKTGRVDFIAKADYQSGSELDTIVTDIIQEMALRAILAQRNKEQLRVLGDEDF